mgnify:CR=1 FL=1
MGRVAYHTCNGPKLPIPALQEVCLHAEGEFQGSLPFVTPRTGIAPSSSILCVWPQAMGRLRPLFYEGVVRSLVTLPAPVPCVHTCLEGCQGFGPGGVFDVLCGRPMAILALYVHEPGIRDGGISDIRVGCDIAQITHRMAGLTVVRCVPAGLKSLPGLCVVGLLPLGLRFMSNTMTLIFQILSGASISVLSMWG